MNPEIQGQKPRWDTNRFTCLECIKLLLELCYYEFVTNSVSDQNDPIQINEIASLNRKESTSLVVG
jgi:hypothetical protein